MAKSPRAPAEPNRQFPAGDTHPGSLHEESALWRMQPLVDDDGHVVMERVADRHGMSRAQVAETAGVKPSSLYKAERFNAPKTQARMREMIEIVGRVTGWAGGPIPAMAWYRSEPIAAFGGRTAEALVKDGKAAAVRDYLDSLAVGSFA